MKRTYRIALGGILSSLAVAILFFGSIIPFATFIAPAISSLCVLYFCIEYNNRVAFAVYFVISVLAILVAPDKEMALLFALVIGYFPVLKSWADRKLLRWAAAIVKFAVFNISVAGLYLLAIQVFHMPLLAEEFSDYSAAFIIGLLVAGNAMIFLLDRAMNVLTLLYLVKIKPKLQK